MADSAENGNKDHADSGRAKQARSIKVKGEDGDWREISVEPAHTGDSEMDQLWNMPISEFQEIIDDPTHPLHGKAQEVQGELAKSISGIAARASEHMAGLVKQNLVVPENMNLLPKIDMSSWVGKVLPDFQYRWIPGSSVHTGPGVPGEEEAPVVDETIGLAPPALIDFNASVMPNASVLEVDKAIGLKSYEIHVRQLEAINSLVEYAKNQEKSGEKSLWWTRASFIVSLVVLGVAAATLIVTVVQ